MEVATSNGVEVNQKAALSSALSLAKSPWSEEEAMERRNFLGALTAASIGVLFESSLTQLARAENNARAGARPNPPISFETSQVQVSGNTIFVRRYGTGPAILMVHGFPRTSLMWRFLAPKLAENHTVICVDLRAYGRSGIPASTDDHFPYSKRAMAVELVGVMEKLGFPTFTLIGHDRGGRVSYRLALDHPKAVERLAVFDVIPILEAWNRFRCAVCPDVLALDLAVAAAATSRELSARCPGSGIPQPLRAGFVRPGGSRRIRYNLSRYSPRSRYL
jgi:haloacetate dehalogenase